MLFQTWQCSRCRQTHTGKPQSYAFRVPWPWYITPKPERDRNCTLTEDYCVLFDEGFFVTYIELEPTDHPLAVEQRNGISRPRLHEIAELVEHKRLHLEWDVKGLYGGAS